MKRIALTVAAALMFATAAPAQAVDVKVKGTWDFAFGVIDNKPLTESANRSNGRTGVASDDDHFEARQRVRTQVNFIASEYLQGVLMFEIGDIDWGRDKGKLGQGSGGALDSDGVNIETRLAYLDWIIPSTDVSIRMGIQNFCLPSGRMGNPVFTGDVAGVVVNTPLTDWLGATAFWLRPFDQSRDRKLSDETDLFGLVAPISFDSFAVSPYFMYGFIGGNSGYYDYTIGEDPDLKNKAKAWWLGANLNVDIIDSLTFNMDAIYGRQQRIELDTMGEDRYGTSGWYIGATLDYALDWGTPGIFGWWASGDKDSSADSGKYGRIPVLGLNDGFMATTFGMGGYYAIGNGGNSALISTTGTGTWGVGLQIADMSFIEDLNHTIRVAYYRGTNSDKLVKSLGGEAPFINTADNFYLTKDDSVIEVNFDHTYKIYDNLTAILELGYLRLSSDQDTWGSEGMGLKDNDDAWKAELSFRYAF